MKTKITPEVLEQFNELNQPARITVTGKGVFFNKVATRLLAISIGSIFTMEIEDAKLYYRDDTTGFKVTTAMKNSKLAVANGISKLVQKELNGKDSKASMCFEVGTLTNGRRLLTAVL